MTPRASMNCYHARMDLEIRHLQLVAAIAETGSVTRAGERLNLSQSALSHQLRDIEDRLNTALFHRVGRRMVLTPAGEEVRRAAAQVLEIVRRAEEGIRDSAAGKVGVLRISTACYTCYHWLPAILREYRTKRPGVDVQVYASETTRPVAGLLEGRLDLAIVSDRFRDSRLTETPLFEDDLVVITARDHPLAARPYVRAEDFAKETLIVYPPREDSTVINRVLAPAGVAPGAVQMVQLTEAIIELVKAGLGVAAMAKWAVRPHIDAGTIRAVRLTRGGFKRRWRTLTLRAMAAEPFIKDFIELVARRSPSTETRVRKSGVLRFEQAAR